MRLFSLGKALPDNQLRDRITIFASAELVHRNRRPEQFPTPRPGHNAFRVSSKNGVTLGFPGNDVTHGNFRSFMRKILTATLATGAMGVIKAATHPWRQPR
jgi:hypothetical protein